MVDRNYCGNTVLTHIFDMCAEVYYALLQRFCVFSGKFCLGNAAVVLERTDSSDYNGTRGLKTCITALYIEELLCTEITAEACLRDSIFSELKRKLCCSYAITAVSDIRKRTAVDYCRRVFECLYKVGVYCVFQQSCHSSYRFDIRSVYGLSVIGIRYKYSSQSCL